MVSKNKLLGSGVDYESLAKQLPRNDEVQKIAPAWRFHKTCPEGRVIKTDKAIKELDKAGWVDHPGKVRKLPGHENMFKGEEDKGSSLDGFSDSDKGSNIDHSDKKG